MLNTGLNRAPIERSASILILIALLAIAVPIAGLAASAQTPSASFSGSLLDALNRAVPDVPMAMTKVENEQRFNLRTDQAGRFGFVALPAGEYLLEVRNPGFTTLKIRIKLSEGQQLQQGVVLQIGMVAETIVVSASAQPAKPAAPRPMQASQAPAVDPCSQSGLGGCITPPRKLTDARPRYPDQHAAAGMSGTVEIDGLIDTEGYVTDLRPASGDSDFVSATIDAVRQWRFSATRLDGVPVNTRIHITARFEAGR